MNIILVRHGQRQGTKPESDDPLTPDGEFQAKDLAEHLKTAGDIPILILTSEYIHAQQTAKILQERLNRAALIIPLRSLTPSKPDYPGVDQEKYAQAMWHELSSKAGVPSLKNDATVIVVLHYPRQVQLALDLQGKDPKGLVNQPEPGRGETIGVSI